MTVTVSLPHFLRKSTAASCVSSEVSTPLTTSTSGVKAAGIRKWVPIHFSGLLVAAPISEILSVDVLLARIASSRQVASAFSKSVLLRVISS